MALTVWIKQFDALSFQVRDSYARRTIKFEQDKAQEKAQDKAQDKTRSKIKLSDQDKASISIFVVLIWRFEKRN